MARGRYLFISDLHLDASAPDAIELFHAFLREVAFDSAGLYILGDLFETWVGDDDDEPARDAVCRALAGLTSRGVPCWVQRGNRDFLLGSGFMARTGCRLLPDPLLLELGTKRIVVSHGDLLCLADTRYQLFRALVRSPSFQRGYLALPLATRRDIAAIARRTSRKHTRQLREEIADVEAGAVAALLRTARSDLLIHGHTHRTAEHRIDVDGRACTRVVLPDWYEGGGFLALDEAGNYALSTLAAGTPE